MKLIGLAGKARVGKDTAADHLTNFHGFDRYALASPIRNGIKAIFSLTDTDLNECKEQALDIGFSPRQLMQTLGTEWGRDVIHPELWLMLADKMLIECLEVNSPGLVITDIRFDNEAEWVHLNGGEVWQLERTDAQEVNAHSSEDGISPELVDIVIYNNRDLDTLAGYIDAALDGVTPAMHAMMEMQDDD